MPLTDEEMRDLQAHMNARLGSMSVSGIGMTGINPAGLSQSNVSRMPLRSEVTEPMVQQPQQPTWLQSIGHGLGNALSVATNPLVHLPRTGNPLLDFLESGVEGVSSPLGLATTLFAPVTGGASLGLGGLAGAAARAGTRIGAEALLGATAGAASEKAQELLPEDTNPFIRGGVGLAAGLAGGAAATRALRAVPAFAPIAKTPFGVKVARDPEFEAGGSRFGQTIMQPTGVPVRGTPINPDDPSISDMLYSVVGNARQVKDTGRLRTSGLSGTFGSPLDEVNVLFGNQDSAGQLAADFKTISNSFKQGQQGVIQDLQSAAARDGVNWTGVFPKGTPTEDIITDFFNARSAQKAGTTLGINPLDFENISTIRQMKPNDIGVVSVAKPNMKTGAMLTEDTSGSVSNYNLYGDVGLATNTQIQAAEADPDIRKFINQLEAASQWMMTDPEGLKALKANRSQELASRVAKSEALMRAAKASGKSPDEIQAIGRSALAGPMDVLQLPPQFALDQNWLPGIKTRILDGMDSGTAPYTFFDGQHALEALDNLFIGGQLPNKSNTEALQKVLGLQFTTALEKFRTPTLKDKFMDILNIPRALIASGDVSYPLRQGLLLGLADPVAGGKMIWNSLHAFASPTYADEAYRLASGLTGTPLQQAKTNALLRWGMDVLGGAGGAEEQFRTGLLGRKIFGSNEAGRILQASDRSFATAGNIQRWEVGQKYVDDLIRTYLKPGEDATSVTVINDILKNRVPEQDGKRLADTLNILTGRTSWKKLTQGETGQILNAGFFSPGFFAARLQAPFLLPMRAIELAKQDPSLLLNPYRMYSQDPAMRLQARMFGGLVAQGLGFYGAMKVAQAYGLPDVNMELDPRKSDFGKLKVGTTYYDPWGGYTPMVRALAQEITGERISQRGEKYATDRMEVVKQFLRSKVSPTVGFGWDALSGQTFTNQRVSFEKNSLEDRALASLVPLFMQDVVTGFKEGGLPSAAAMLPSAFGLGVQSYQSMPQLKDSIASEITGGRKTNFNDLTGPEKQLVLNDARVIQKQTEFEQGIPAGSFSEAIRKIQDDRTNQEKLFMWRAATGQDTRKQLADNMAELQRITTAKREQSLKDFNVPGAAAPTSALQEALNAWRSLYDAADLGASEGIKTNKIDWDKFETMQKELFAQLTPEQIDFIEQRSKYQATPEAQWWFNNRDYVNSSKYYDIPDRVYKQYANQVRAVDRNIQTYGQLLNALDYLKYSNFNKYQQLNKIMNGIKTDVSDERKALREKDPKLDAALYTLGRANKLQTLAAAKLLGGAQAWIDADTGTSD